MTNMRFIAIVGVTGEKGGLGAGERELEPLFVLQVLFEHFLKVLFI